MERIKLNIDDISKELYDKILEEFREEFGEGHFDNWEVSADKEEIDDRNDNNESPYGQD